ncbi:hypothetical protein D3C78_957620 [compost metagenome]
MYSAPNRAFARGSVGGVLGSSPYFGPYLSNIAFHVSSMNWYRPVADEDLDFTRPLKLDSKAAMVAIRPGSTPTILDAATIMSL